MFRLILFFLFFCFSVNSYSQSDNISVKDKVFVCSTCHGETGNSVVPVWPKLAGQFSKYLVKQLEEFKLGEKGLRFEPIMYGIVKDFSTQDFIEIADYFSLQKISENVVLLDVNKLGKKIYLSGDIKKNIVSCSSCHGVLGDGGDFANIPKLRNQHSAYISLQLQKYKTGIRSNDVSNIMRDISQKMSDEEIFAVSDYISNL